MSIVTSNGSYPHNGLEIDVSLQSKKTHEDFLSHEVVLDTRCHEPAHLWDSSHELEHIRKWWDIRQEVENDLGGRLRIERGQDSDHAIEKFLWMAWEDRQDSTVGVKKLRTPSATAIAAARLWESWYWDFNKVREYADLPKNIGAQESAGRERDTVVKSERNTTNEPVQPCDEQPCETGVHEKLELLPRIEL
jgi:hypothetical protein